MMLTDLADVLRKGGLRVSEVDGWKTRTHKDERGRRLEMASVDGVTCHHNAGGRTLNPLAGLRTIVEGREGLAGPLSHLYLGRDGLWHTVAAGLCWHAGESRLPTYTNSHRIGVEAQAAGDGWSEDWPAVQYDAYALGAWVLSDHYGFPIEQVLGHKETCSPPGRKSDPSFPMDTFRAAVRAAGLKEDDMKPTDKLTFNHTDAIALGDPSREGDPVAVGTLLRGYTPPMARLRREQAAGFAALKAQVGGLQKVIDAQAKAMQALATGTASDVKAAFETGMAGIHAELDELQAAVEAHTGADEDDEPADAPTPA